MKFCRKILKGGPFEFKCPEVTLSGCGHPIRREYSIRNKSKQINEWLHNFRMKCLWKFTTNTKIKFTISINSDSWI